MSFSLINARFCVGDDSSNIFFVIIFHRFPHLFQVTPCVGWLNNNATMRRLTTERAQNLSRTMKEFAKTNIHRWANMEINYVDCPINTGNVEIIA